MEFAEFRERVCPSCGCAPQVNIKSSSRVQSEPPAECQPFQTLSDHWRGFRAKNIFFTYVRCDNCELLYCPRYFTEDQLRRLYSFMDDNSAGEDLGILSRTQTRYATELENIIHPTGHWLELGADIGLLSAALLSNTAIGRLDVIEPNHSVHGQLTTAISGKGQIVSSLEAADSGSYDGVIAVHVLDHLPNLGVDLERIAECLCSGGIVCFVTHNEDSVLRRLLSRRWPPFCLQHPQLFSQKTITRVLNHHGFEVLQVSRTTNYFRLKHAASVLFSILKIPKGLLRFVPEVAIPMKLGNIVTYARRLP